MALRSANYYCHLVVRRIILSNDVITNGSLRWHHSMVTCHGSNCYYLCYMVVIFAFVAIANVFTFGNSATLFTKVNVFNKLNNKQLSNITNKKCSYIIFLFSPPPPSYEKFCLTNSSHEVKSLWANYGCHTVHTFPASWKLDLTSSRKNTMLISCRALCLSAS